jgi:helix-turn-helix protein
MNLAPKPPLSLDALAANPALIAGLEPAEVCAVLTLLAGLQAALGASLLNHREPLTAGPDRMLSLEEASGILQQTPEWIRRRAGRLPFAKRISRKKLLFSENGLNRWLANRRA